MTPEDLDERLRAVTEHEQLYRQGISPPNPQQFLYLFKGKKRVALLHFGHFSEVFSNPLDIVVKKHSRFRSYPLHIHDWVEINYMYDGSCRQIINNNLYSLHKGQILLVDSDTVHTIEPLGESDILINIIMRKEYFNSSFFNRLASDSPLSSFFINSITEGNAHDSFILFRSENSRRLPIFMNEFFCEWFDPSVRSTEMLDSLFSLIMMELIHIYETDLTREGSRLKTNPIVPVLRYIEENYRTCTLNSTAAYFNTNANYLSAQLKKYTGMSFIALLHQQKIRFAKTLLINSTMNVTEIANYVGYENVSFFYKKFNAICGCSPNEYRNI
ncbi:AraC family transcriptional regulator [Paenibacillus sp. MMS20-IR301]|uniref:AraC family transcriptional regulator n=1 Tax=Paenibacillus sp. MMS20-IR301 TaxID=2895946 RepID=UPI0028EDB34D|nr:AraC family transcriptional regulator [Paenibacillus sp. MMS20-IR301]WNS41397.1 AraC family transcriptional regulator [Paenibacillus sp. MMS20-IR301]